MFFVGDDDVDVVDVAVAVATAVFVVVGGGDAAVVCDVVDDMFDVRTTI